MCSLSPIANCNLTSAKSFKDKDVQAKAYDFARSNGEQLPKIKIAWKSEDFYFTNCFFTLIENLCMYDKLILNQNQ
jgi:hypothetical protein